MLNFQFSVQINAAPTALNSVIFTNETKVTRIIDQINVLEPLFLRIRNKSNTLFLTSRALDIVHAKVRALVINTHQSRLHPKT
jgi:hypothetical protein